MSIQLAEVPRQEAEREAKRERELDAKRYLAPTLPASAYVLSGAELARECELAVAYHPLARSLKLARSRESVGPVAYSKRSPRKSSDREARPAPILSDEGQALAAMVAERVYRRKSGGRGSARDVLRYIDRVERFPALYARGDSGVPRSRVGREYLRRVVSGLLAESREWRDTAESYRTRSARDRDTGPMVESIDAMPDPDMLTAASAREHERSTGEPLPALPLDTARVSDAMGLALVVAGANREAVTTALRMAAGVPLASIARDTGKSLRTVAGRSAAGAAWLRENVAPGELVALMRLAADATGDVVPADERAPMLPASARSAADAIDRAARTLSYLPGPTPGRVDGATARDVRTIAGSVADRLTPERTPADPRRPGDEWKHDRAPFPAASAWRVHCPWSY